MPDIAMCANDACPSASKCYRHEAKPSNWQTYAVFAPEPGAAQCDDFLPIWKAKEASHE